MDSDHLWPSVQLCDSAGEGIATDQQNLRRQKDSGAQMYGDRQETEQ